MTSRKNDNIYTIKMITSPTLENDNIQAFQNEKNFTWKMIRSATLETDNIWTFKNDNIYTMTNDTIRFTW
jgi:hypothetical protein